MQTYRTTPFPSYLIDEVMPKLKDSEWRLICILVRQTYGWSKEWDWVSTSQLRARSGRESAAISHAIESLVCRGLIEVRARSGLRVHTPEDRRKAKEGLLFRLKTPDLKAT